MILGLIFAIIASLSWGVCDFFIQKSTRKSGNWETLFVISLFGMIALFPFIYKKIHDLGSESFLYLFVLSLLMLISTLLTFESFKLGKLAITDPLYALEIPIVGILSFFLLGEKILTYQTVLIAVLVIGLFLISTKSLTFSKKGVLEKGVLYALIGALIMGFSCYLIGYNSRNTDPLLTTWFFSSFITCVCFIYLIWKKKIFKIKDHILTNQGHILTSGIIDNIAWISYAIALSITPMVIVAAIVESSIVINVLLGIYINKEKIILHQKIGLVMVMISAIVLVTSMG